MWKEARESTELAGTVERGQQSPMSGHCAEKEDAVSYNGLESDECREGVGDGRLDGPPTKR